MVSAEQVNAQAKNNRVRLMRLEYQSLGGKCHANVLLAGWHPDIPALADRDARGPEPRRRDHDSVRLRQRHQLEAPVPVRHSLEERRAASRVVRSPRPRNWLACGVN